MNKPRLAQHVFCLLFLGKRARVTSARLPAFALAMLATGCSFAPTYERPAAPVANLFPGQTASAGQAADALPWQAFVQDANLRALVEQALANNRDLRVALLNIEQVRAQYQIRRADQFPTVNVAATGNRQTAANDNDSGNSSITSRYSVGLAVTSWEIDFFGRVASLKQAALAQYLASEEAAAAAQTTLVAAVASTWLSLQTSDQLLALTRQTLATREDALRLTQLRLDNGASSALDLRQAESLTAAARAALAQQSRQRALDVNALTLLVGQTLAPNWVSPAVAAPARVAAPANTAPSVADPPSPISPVAQPVPATNTPAAFAVVPEGLPSGLLERRADIRQAEQALVAANANIGAARAAFFPRISLTASLGSTSTALSELFKDGSWGFNLAPQALLPIFDAGRNQAGLESAQAARDIAVAAYEKAIQTAFREVADALAGRYTLVQQLAALQAQTDAEADRFRLADLRYKSGVASYLDVLDAQRSMFSAQQALLQIKLAEQQNQVALFKALGGGWSRLSGAR